MSDSQDSENGGEGEFDTFFDELITLGEKTEFQPMKWLFPNTKKCPLRECGHSFPNRMNALAHFDIYHAKTSMLCTVCDKLFDVENPLCLLIHHKKRHPNNDPPALKSTNDNFEDIITLNGGGETTRWKYPQQSHCAIETCNVLFSSRQVAIVHFKDQHANKSAFCNECKTPILANHPEDLKQHNYDFHRPAEQPVCAKKQNRLTLNENSQKNATQTGQREIQNEENIWMTVNRSSEKVCWTFPHTKRCPVKGCLMVFENRLAAIHHYKQKHLPNVTFCSLCEIPIYARFPSNVKAHYDRYHSKEPKTAQKTNSPKKDVSSANDNMNREDGLVELSGGGHITYWHFPENTTICPVISCCLRFPNRSGAIDHYKERHAKFAILCPVCNKPIRVDCNKYEFVSHFRRCHPTEQVPLGYEDIMKNYTPPRQTLVTTTTIPSNKSDQIENSENENDIITLRGLNQISKWTFPNTTKCPFLTCRQNFKTRNDAINHYKGKHAAYGILCTICNKPICVRTKQDFMKHYKRIHLDVPYPIQSQHQLVNDDDMITLTGLQPFTYWRFPQTNNCPMKSCFETFKSRSNAITHYKTKHAMNVTLCTQCKHPISARVNNLRTHNQSKHPNVNSIEVDNNTTSVRESNNHKISEKHGHGLPQNRKEITDTSKIVCPLTGCKFETTQIHKLREHWDKEHSELRFPKVRHRPTENSSRVENYDDQSDEDSVQTSKDDSEDSFSQISSIKSSDDESASTYQDPHNNNGSFSSKVIYSNQEESSESDISDVEEERKRKRDCEMRQFYLGSNDNKRRRTSMSSSSSSDDDELHLSDLGFKKTNGSGSFSNSNSDDDMMTTKITAEMLPQCYVLLERLKYPEDTLNSSAKHVSNTPQESELVYVPDSEEENMEQESSMTENDFDSYSNFDVSHIPMMGVLMMAKKQEPTSYETDM